jgi:hypothetical protein
MTHKEKEMELFKVLGVSINFFFPTRTFYIYIYVRTVRTHKRPLKELDVQLCSSSATPVNRTAPNVSK